MINCDDAELDAGSCVAIDGTTVITLLPTPGHGGGPVAKEVVPKSIRPDSDFEWRSDPYRVNGHGSSLMDHGGDWLTANGRQIAVALFNEKSSRFFGALNYSF